MAAPTLSEIANISVDPERGTGTPAVVLDNRESIRQLNEASRFKQEMSQRRYSQNLELLKGVYQDLGQIQGMETMAEDKPLLNKKAQEVFSIIGDNPKETLGGGAQFAQVQQKIGELRALATQSKQDNLYSNFSEKYLDQDPTFDTPENRKMIAEHRNGQLGQRKNFILSAPPSFNEDKQTEELMKQRGIAVPYADDPEFVNGLIITKSGTEYKREPFLASWNAGFYAQPSIEKWAEDQFKRGQKNPQILQNYADPDTGNLPKDAEELYRNLGKIKFGSKEDIKGEKTPNIRPDPYQLLTAKDNFALYLEGVKEGNREKLAKVKSKLAQEDLGYNTDFLIKQHASLLGTETGQFVTTNIGGRQETGVEISAPDFIKKIENYVTTTTREGNAITDNNIQTTASKGEPDQVIMLKDGSIKALWFKKEKGVPVKTADGGFKTEDSKVIPRMTWLTVEAAVLPQKYRASAITNANSYYGKYGNVTPAMRKINAGENPDAETKSYKLGNKTFTQAQVEKAAKASGVSVDEYIKHFGLK